MKSGADAVGLCAQLPVLGAGEAVVGVEERPWVRRGPQSMSLPRLSEVVLREPLETPRRRAAHLLWPAGK